MAVMKSKIPAGTMLVQHVHNYDHDSMLVSGVATVTADDTVTMRKGPALLRIAAGIAHKVEAHTDCEWWCMHEIDEAGNIAL
jgi:quercetin dioxygenase-like cupin family protein